MQVTNIRKRFGGVAAVDGCSFSIAPQKITALIGPNGAGKTTLFNIIGGLVKPDAGTIMLDKQNVTDMTPHRRARLGISRTFQLPRIFRNMTVEENLRLARPDVTKEAMRDVLEQVKLKKSLDAEAASLSYGQQRLLEIARALIFPHKLLLLDEPTAGVNPVVRHEIAAILKQLKKQGKTVLLIEHDMDFVMSVSDEIVVMEEGRVLMQGTPATVRKDKRVLEAYLGPK